VEVNERVGQTGRVVDHQFSDIGLAALYDVLHPWDQRDDLDFDLELVMTADSSTSAGRFSDGGGIRARAPRRLSV
jgi:hypothetical protein